MAYNLPDAWDPGFVLPKNVQDEGIERRAFITKMLPRGSYDDSTDGTGGYVVPQYVLDEGTGQGTHTTKWMPGGTYVGPRIPNWLNRRPKLVQTQRLPGGATQVAIQPLGDVPFAEPYESYGQRAARELLARVSSLPSGQRQAALKGILDRADKSAWSRANDIFKRYVRQGMAYPEALQNALARALSAGMAAEVIRMGSRSGAPQVSPPQGLGCYSCIAALGADWMDTVTGGPIRVGATPTVATAPAPYAGPVCAAPDGYTWVEATATVAGHWERLRAGQKPNPGPCGTTPEVRDQRKTYDYWVGPFGFDTTKLADRVWAVGDPSPSIANRDRSPDIVYLSPDPAYEIPAGTGQIRPITPDVLLWLKQRLQEEVDPNGYTDTPVHYGDKSAMYGFPEPEATPWFQALGINPDTPVRMHNLAGLRTTISPFAKTKHIKTGADMVLHVSLAPLDRGKALSSGNPMVLKVWLSRVPDPSIFGALWNPMIFINPLTALQATMSVVSSGQKWLADQACDLLSDPQGRAAAGAAAGTVAAAYGIPPQAGVAGVSVAAGMCGGQQQPAPVVAPQPSILPWVLAAGGGVVLIALFTRKKKRP